MGVMAGSAYVCAHYTLFLPVAAYVGRCRPDLFSVGTFLQAWPCFVFGNRSVWWLNFNHLSLETHREAAVKNKAKGAPFSPPSPQRSLRSLEQQEAHLQSELSLM